jgi:ABC-type sugar transport system, periplasmic component
MKFSLLKNKFKRFGVLALVIAVIVVNPAIISGAESLRTLAEKTNSIISTDVVIPEGDYYSNYLKEKEGSVSDYSGADIVVPATTAQASDGQNHNTNSEQTKGVDALVWENATYPTLSFEFEVPQDAFYNIALEFLAFAGTTNPHRGVMIDGEYLFKEMNTVILPRLWKDDAAPWENSLNDEVRSKQTDISGWQEFRFTDASGKYETPLKYHLTAGKHTITFTYISEAIAIKALTLKAPEQILSYAEVKSDWAAKGYKEVEATDENYIKIEAEDFNHNTRNDGALKIQTNSDPSCSPMSGSNRVYNTIGGSVWATGGQTINWNFDIKNPGIYKISLRQYQQFTDGMPIYRQILIDGKVPYEEASIVRFDFKDWTLKDLGSEEGVFSFYFDAGKHTFSMTAKTGPYAEVVSLLETDAYRLSNIIQQVIKITTIDPDVNYDYKLAEKVPGITDDLTVVSKSLEWQINYINTLSNKRPKAVNNLAMIKAKIDKMIANPFEISRGLRSLMDDQGTMASWITDFQNSPLQIDYLEIKSPSAKTKDYGSSIWTKLGVTLNTFFTSFTKDYDTTAGMGGEGGGSADAKTLDLWISRSREWAEVLQYMADEDFSKENNVNIKMNVVPAGAFGANGVIMLALASGQGPDLALGVASNVPFEYGIRDSVFELQDMPGYDDVVDRFLPGIMIPFEFEGKSYGLPETMDFSVMFYRTDIMQGLNLQIPNTWEDLYSKVLPTLKKNGMDFWFEGGYHTFLMQNGGSYYTADGRRSALDTPEAFTAFKQFTEIFTIYDVPKALVSFYSSFRTGQVPIGISSFNTFIQLTAAAPEINGKWDVAMIPGTKQADGRINRSYGGGTTAAFILKNSELTNESWKFLDWYTSKDVQAQYASDIMTTVGMEARWCSANVEAFDQLPWENSLRKVITEQREWYVDTPNVIGGYILARHLENARVRSVVQNKPFRDALEQSIKDINRELDNKNEEFRRRAEYDAQKKTTSN